MARCSVWTIVLQEQHHRVLLLKRSSTVNNPGLWNFPGGGIELDKESWRGAASRELFEEAGIHCPPETLTFAGHNRAVIYFMVKTEQILSYNVKINEESDTFAWATYEGIKELLSKKLLHSKTEWFFQNKDFLESHLFQHAA